MQLSNSYWLLRHGRSLANEAGIIVSNLEAGKLPQYTLASAGRLQASAAGRTLRSTLEQNGQLGNVHVVASPFSRTQETARLAAAELGISGDLVQAAEELRERYFGDYDLESDSNYDTVWAADKLDPTERPSGDGESVADVAERLERFIQRTEAEHTGRTLLLVSHGDTLSILMAVAKLTPLAGNRSYGLNTGELQEMHRISDGVFVN